MKLQNNAPKIYKHKNHGRAAIKIAVCVICALIILSVAVFLNFKKYIAYTDTGKLYLDIPWLSGYMDGPPETDELADILTQKN